jgi:hypothetical protein
MTNLCEATSINDFNYFKTVQVFQNPFITKISVSPVSSEEKYQIYNSIGQLKWMGKDIEDQDFFYLVNGIYLLKLTNKNSNLAFKIIKNQ